MKQILIIASGEFARHFLSRVNKLKDVMHEYRVVAKDAFSVPEALQKEQNFTVEIFDPTSIERLRVVLSLAEFDRCIMIMDDEFDAKVTLENLKTLAPDLELYAADFWGLLRENKNEAHVKIVNTLALNSSRFIGFLPDSPVFAGNIGLGRGEIMEVKVPIGSSFAYKKLSTLRNDKYQIPMIYRHNNYIVTSPGTRIYPNDTILVVGEPSALRAVFAEVKKQKGQFPSPFGLNIYALIDMKKMSEEGISKAIRALEFLDGRIKNHKIYLRILNPTINDEFARMKELCERDKFEILIDYSGELNLKRDISENKAGLLVCSSEVFEAKKSALKALEIPVLSLGENELKDVEKSVVISGGERLREESSIVFDISSQLGIDVYLHLFGDAGGKRSEIAQSYLNFSKLFDQNLHIVEEEGKNPILALGSERNILQFVPFNDRILGKKITAIFKMDLDQMYFKLGKNHQIFIPDDYGYEK